MKYDFKHYLSEKIKQLSQFYGGQIEFTEDKKTLDYYLQEFTKSTIEITPTKKKGLTTLPEVRHYRSSPSKQAKAVSSPCDSLEDYYGCSMYGSYYDPSKRDAGRSYTYPRSLKSVNYGYGKNAVLECPDIEEFRSC